MELLLFWFIGAIIVGAAAAGRGRGGFAWFLLALLISPLLALVAVLVLPRIEDEPATEPDASGTTPIHTRCPDCREIVRRDARKCKHCGSALVPEISDSATARTTTDGA
ncbi:MAG TPA: hypothetical protein PK177_13995 [Burkholderiaceae bacterium]|nr:hypothetical protein [Burkholderiaceae bacterium]